MSKRRTHSPEFKARVAMEAINGRMTIQESQWTLAAGWWTPWRERGSRSVVTVSEAHGNQREAKQDGSMRLIAAIPLPGGDR